jgi:hypothetical protein
MSQTHPILRLLLAAILTTTLSHALPNKDAKTPAPKTYNCALLGSAPSCGIACYNALRRCDLIMSVTGINDQASCIKAAVACGKCCITTTVTATSESSAKTQCLAGASTCASTAFITCANQEQNCQNEKYNGYASAACCSALGDLKVTACPPGTDLEGCCSLAWHIIADECHCGNQPNYVTSTCQGLQ